MSCRRKGNARVFRPSFLISGGGAARRGETGREIVPYFNEAETPIDLKLRTFTRNLLSFPSRLKAARVIRPDATLETLLLSGAFAKY